MPRSLVLGILGAVCLIGFWSFWAQELHGLWAEEHGQHQHGQYLLGVGKADITGPPVEINFMGYADPAQLGTGLRQRLYSRAFIVGDLREASDRFVYLVLDTQSGDTAIRHGILQALNDLGGDYAMYGQQNVAVTGTHSHSGPGAWLNYLLPQITSRGFHKPSYQAIVDGAVASIQQAHQTLAPGRLSVGTIDIPNGNINRSPYAYLANPEEERSKYSSDVDKTLTLLRFTHTKTSVFTDTTTSSFLHTIASSFTRTITSSSAKDIGVLTFFPVHGTSMYGKNTLVTGDNKGVAASLFEKAIDNPSFVAGFSQANVGDTSPNTEGAYCESGPFAGEECDFETSLCGNRTQPCHGRGPHWNLHDFGTASTYEIGRRQASAAISLFHSPDSKFTHISGSPPKSHHHFADLSSHTFTLPNKSVVTTCPAALGYSFAAGTTDGPGAFDFKQAQPGDPHANPLWSLIGNRIATPNETQRACHHPKVILLDVGESSDPYAWSPNIVDIQLLRVGQLFLILAPGEATTMSGRRWRAAISSAALSQFPKQLASTPPITLLGGPANTYAHYIATAEEYSIQRYEGASTLFGPHTLDAYIDLSVTALPALDASAPASSPRLRLGPDPPVNTNTSLSFITPVVVDRAPFFRSFGDVLSDVRRVYAVGESVRVEFVAANPRNNLRLGGDETHAAVEERVDDATGLWWRRVRDDGDWDLVFEWERTSTVTGTSKVTVTWETKWEGRRGVLGEDDEEEGHGELLRTRAEGEGLRGGTYRLKYFGDAKGLGGGITAFEGTSAEFEIV